MPFEVLLTPKNGSLSICLFAGIAQLVERQLPKLDVAGSNPVSRSMKASELSGAFLIGVGDEWGAEDSVTPL